ncbi:MAG TPA: cupin domain-containing protein, partial [Vicinamibacterales bacterium]|nr:cupin domain-containing protein [Vicinamibacterales bacterium]
RLYRDRPRGTVTELVRMAAGTRLPGHRHITSEEFYLLSGDAQIAGERLDPGDYYRAAASTSHDVTFTERGCEFLLISSAVETLA